MAFTLKIKLTGQSQFTDFSNFIFPQGGTLASKTFALNSIQQLDFALKEASGFVSPERGNEVWLDCSTYSPSGELFTGFIAADPEKEIFAQETDGSVRFVWKVMCQSEESICNFSAPLYMSTLTPFQNQTVGQIVSYLLNLLAPGRFDTSGVQPGPVIPYYLPGAQANFTDIVKELVEGAGMKFWTRRKKAFLSYFDDAAVGVNCLSADAAFNPDDITITPYAQPIFNDVIGYGGEEPQVYVREYYAGDGLTMTFPLHLPVWGLTTSDLIVDDFNNTAVDTSKWVATDPTSSMSEGASLFIAGGAGLNQTKLAAVQGVELAGTLFFQHGAVRFNSASSGIIGGIYTSPSAHTQGNCLLGFRVVTYGPDSFLQPVVSGLTQGGDLDDFNRPNGSLGGSWTAVSGSFSVSGNEVYLSTSGSNSRAVASWSASGSAPYPNDQWSQVKVTKQSTSTTRSIGAAVRVAPTGQNFYGMYSASDITYLFKVVAGTTTVLSQVSRVPGANEVQRVTAVGQGISGYINGALTLTGSDAALVSGSPGIHGIQVGTPDPHCDDWQAGWMNAPWYGPIATSGGTDYILQTQVQAPERLRRLRNFSSLQTPSGFGGVDVASSLFASMRALALSESDASLAPTSFELYNGTVTGAPTFSTYVPFNSENLNIAVNFLEVSSPMDVLAMTLPSGSSSFRTYTLGAQKEVDKDGSIVAQSSNQPTQNFLTLGQFSLFGLVAPSAGDAVELRYRSAGQMVSRVVAPSSIVLEAARLGDSGVRAGILPQLNFAPRNQAELEFAIKSYIDDRDSPIFQGTYSFTTLRYTPPTEPVPGRFFTVNVSGSYPSFQAFLNNVRTDVVVESPSLPSGQAEIMNVALTYGNLDKFQTLMTQLALQDQGGQSNINIRGVTLPTSTDFSAVGTSKAPNLPDFRYTYARSATGYGVDFGQLPPTGPAGDAGHFEVRSWDSNWGLPGVSNLVAEVTGQSVTLRRSSRAQQFFARGIVPINFAVHSGFEDGVNYLSASGTNPPTGSYDATRGSGDFGCIKVVFPAASAACSGSLTNCALSALPSALVLAGRFKFMASRPLTGLEEIRFKLAGTFNPTAETALTSANVGSGTYSSFRDFAVGPTTATPTGATNARLTLYVKTALGAALTGWVDDVQIEKAPGALGASPYYRTVLLPKGYSSRYSSLVQVNFPLVPQPPSAGSTAFDGTDTLHPQFVVGLPQDSTDVFGVQVRDTDNATTLYSFDNLALGLNQSDPGLVFVFDNHALKTRSRTLHSYFYNLLGEFSSDLPLTISLTGVTVTGVGINEQDQSVFWGLNPTATSYQVELSSGATFPTSAMITSGSGMGNRMSIRVDDVVNTRWFRVSADDGLGYGAATSGTHSYNCSGAVSFDNTSNVKSIGFPPSAGADPTFPPAFAPHLPIMVQQSWDDHFRETNRLFRN